MPRKTVVRICEIAFTSAVFLWPGCRFIGSDAGQRLQEAEQYYLAGTSSNHASQYEESAYYLKQAEDALLRIPPSDMNSDEYAKRNRLLGLTWFHLGNTSESEMLYDIAQKYYEKSIPMLESSKDAVFLACAFRDAARTNAILGGDADSTRYWFQKAAYFADSIGNKMLSEDIAAYYYQYCEPDNKAGMLNACRSLAEEYGVSTRYAEIIEMYLAAGETDSAAYYLAYLHPQDSAYSYWFSHSYAYLHSKILQQQGASEKAYEELLALYDRKIEELQRDAGARTYALSLHYDVAREQQLAEEAQRERRWQRTISIVLVLLLALVITLMLVLWRYWQQRRREQNATIEALQTKYTQQLQLALERLQQKVNLTREMELQRLRGNEPEFPKWLHTYRDEQLTLSKAGIEELIASVDNSLDGAISRLQQEFPQLTESDMQFAILTIIGASDTDMGILLNVQKQTIYHRRQIVRKHVDPRIEDIDSWLRAYVLRKKIH